MNCFSFNKNIHSFKIGHGEDLGPKVELDLVGSAQSEKHADRVPGVGHQECVGGQAISTGEDTSEDNPDYL